MPEILEDLRKPSGTREEFQRSRDEFLEVAVADFEMRKVSRQFLEFS